MIAIVFLPITNTSASPAAAPAKHGNGPEPSNNSSINASVHQITPQRHLPAMSPSSRLSPCGRSLACSLAARCANILALLSLLAAALVAVVLPQLSCPLTPISSSLLSSVVALSSAPCSRQITPVLLACSHPSLPSPCSRQSLLSSSPCSRCSPASLLSSTPCSHAH